MSLSQIRIRCIISFSLLFCLLLVAPLQAQTSENNERLKQALKKYPEADTNKDGILSLEEANQYRVTVMNRVGQGLKQSALQRANKAKKVEPAKAAEGGKKEIYKEVGDVKLPLYIFSPEGHTSEAKVPAIVFFFGGGWANGHPSQFQHQCAYLAKRGMVAISVEYRVARRHGVKVDDCIEDAKSAMRWVRGNAAKLGIDPDRLASGGGSAGGHLGACVFLVDDFDAKTDNTDISAKSNAMVLFNPAMVLAANDLLPELVNKMLKASSKKRSNGDPAKISPLTYVKKKQPPTIMFFGTADRLLAGAEIYAKASKEAGNDCRIVTYKDQGHGFFNHGRNDNKYFDLTIAEMDKFLVELGWLKSK